MTIPTLYHFTEALETPDLAFATLGDCLPCRTATGSVALSRTSRFAEAQIEWRGERYLLCFPLSAASIFAVEQMAAKLKYLTTDLLASYVILRNEMTFTDAAGDLCHSDIILHHLPAGQPLDQCVGDYHADALLAALERLESGLKELGFSHNNLKAENLVVTAQGTLVPIRYHFARFDAGDDARQFEELRALIHRQGGTGQLLRDAEPAAYRTLPGFPGHKFVGEMSDQLIRVEDETGYGFVDTTNRVVIPAQFFWSDDFREGRAAIQTADGQMGLIDKTGHFVIEPHYEIVEYNAYTGCSRVRRKGLWALADYNGKIGEFSSRYIEENEYA